MPEIPAPPDGVLQFIETKSVLLSGSFRRGDFARTSVKVKTSEGWRAATPDEERWVLVFGDRFAEDREAERASQ